MWTGSSGSRLRNILRKLGYNLEDIFFITDVVKCLPPNNRDPFTNEIANCTHFLEKEITLIKPKYILSFGRYALDFLSKRFKAIQPIPYGKITTLHTNKGYPKVMFDEFSVFVLVHPSAAGRKPNILSYDNYRKHLLEIFELIIRENHYEENSD